ncbi:hypothetical protein V5O48_013114 [Marasmius crinis-equi]|uniref:Uncharacterized protein n=1 Tax=Marasmius crinis-equi TaxID=585013 RepID=A0ABR3F0Z4_9AGAR
MSVHLHHLNADCAWLLTFSNNPQRLSPGDTTLTLLIDPWLDGPEVDIHRWFLTQHHSSSTPPQFHEFPSLVEFLSSEGDPRKGVDAIIITFPGSDHLHKATIDTVGPEVPFFAFPMAAAKLRSWGREHVYEIPKGPGFLAILDGLLEAEARVNCQGRSRKVFFESLNIKLSFIDTGSSTFYDDSFRGALALTFAKCSGERGALLYQPHGTPFDQIKRWKSREESEATTVDVFAFIAGWDFVKMPDVLGGVVCTGSVENAKIAQELSPRYWLRTHDEETVKSGLIPWFLRRDIWSKERMEAEIDGLNAKFVDMEVGETLSMPMAIPSAA